MDEAMRSLVWLLFLSACGGKIVEVVPERDPTFMPVPVPAQQPSPAPREEERPPEPVAVTPSTKTSVDACAVLCERDARCDTTIPAIPARVGESSDCDLRCRSKLEAKCGMDDWLLCYASRIEPNVCTPLPDECRPAFCAWARCAKQPVSNCE